MSRLSKDFALPNRTAPVLLQRFNALLSKHQTHRRIVLRSGRKLSGEVMLSAIVMRFLDLSPEDQDRVLVEYVPRFEAMLAEEGIEDAPVHTPGFWPGREAQDMTASLKREIRDANKPKKKTHEPGRVAKTEVVPDPKKKGKTG